MQKVAKVVLPFIVVGAAILGAGFLAATRSEIERSPVEERSWFVAAVETNYGEARPYLHVFGEIIAGREVDMRALVSGQIVEVGRAKMRAASP